MTKEAARGERNLKRWGKSLASLWTEVKVTKRSQQGQTERSQDPLKTAQEPEKVKVSPTFC